MSVVDEVTKLHDVAEKYLQQVESCFELMNWYAGPDMMKQWGRTDPQSILAEVYGKLATGYAEFAEAVRGKKEG